MLVPPLDDEAHAATVQFAIIVPSTRDGDPITDAAFEDRIEQVQRWMDERFGGDTTIRGTGDYIDDAGELAAEDVAVVETFMTPAEYRDRKGAIESFIKERYRNWRQDQIGFEFEDDLYVYP